MKIIGYSKIFVRRFLFTLFCIIVPSVTLASEYSPPGLYDFEHIQLPNGLRVILKQRDHAHTTSIRLSVDVGQLDFPCGRRETPHFLEHLLFSGTKKHSESELDAMIEEHGGSWNATTRALKTVYDIDIYSQHALLALDILFEIMTESVISEQGVVISRDIIHREAGGRPSWLRTKLFENGIGRSAMFNAYDIALPGSDYLCPTLETADEISRDDVLKIFEKYYVANNMTLIVVGEFSRDEVMDKLKATFGKLVEGPQKKRKRPAPSNINGPHEAAGLFSPVLGTQAQVGILYRAPERYTKDYYAFNIIETYLATRIFNVLRVERGLAYSPQVSYHVSDKFGLIIAQADVDFEAMEQARQLMEQEILALTQQPLPKEAIAKTKQKILLQIAQGYEANEELAEFYVASIRELKKFNRIISHEDGIEKVTAQDVFTAAKKYFKESNRVDIYDTPTLTYFQFYLLLGIFLVLITLVVWWGVRRYRTRHKNR